ncbi:MAG TPA: transglutaminase-like domain-containing protein, partial [Thermodesulfobacteriota bacterium]|nr:transglutaminase-like domain-containing protein [Thermodesulfobacteriota bacterium]
MTERGIRGIAVFASVFAFSFLAVLQGTSGFGLAATKVLSGKHSIVYDIVNPTGVEFLPDYANSSYSQKVIQEDEFSKRVLVEIDLSPLRSTASFPLNPQQIPGHARPFLGPEKDIQAGEAGISAQAGNLVRGSRTVHEAVTAVFNWIVDNRNYDASPGTPQDARSVFYNRRGSCVG